MSVFTRFSSILFFLIFVSHAGHKVDYLLEGERALAQLLPHPTQFDAIFVHADVPIDQTYLLYLIGIKKSEYVDLKALSSACFYLKHGGQWRAIKVEINGRELIFDLKKNWLVRTIHVHGLWFGKDRVRQHFLIKPGEIFDEQKCVVAVNDLRVFFQKMGYFQAHITENIVRCERDKTIKIDLAIHKGLRLRVRDVKILCRGTHKKLSFVKELIQKQARFLVHQFYDVRAIKKFDHFVRKTLACYGMPCAEISIKPIIVGRGELVLELVIDCMPENKVRIIGNKQVSYQELIEFIFQDDQAFRFMSVPFLSHGIGEWYRIHDFAQAQVCVQKQGAGWLIVIAEGVKSSVTKKCSPLDTILRGRKITRGEREKEQHKIVSAASDCTQDEQKGGQVEKRCDHLNLPQIRSSRVPDEVAKQRSRVYRGSEQTFLGKTVIVGTCPVRSQRILRLLAYQENTPLTVDKLNKTFDNLTHLGIFESMRLFPSGDRDPRGRVPVLLFADMGDPFEAQVRAGIIGTNDFTFGTYTLGGSFCAKNITRNADTLTINAEITRFCRDFSLNYRYPGLAGWPVLLNIPVFDKKTDVMCVGAGSCALYTASQCGMGCNVEFHQAGLRCLMNAGVEATKITHLCEPVARALLFQPALCNKFVPYLYFEPSFFFNTVDDAFNPQTGTSFHAYARCVFALHERAASFVRLLAEQSLFVPCTQQITGAVRLRAGYIFCSKFSCLMPSERFYLGGASTVRAYQQDMMAPLAWCNHAGCQLWVPTGSRATISASAELRIVLTQTLGIVPFQDIGCLRDERNRRWCFGGATGIGVRYITPIGPLRFDIGFKNKSVQNDCVPFAWFLTIGQAF